MEHPGSTQIQVLHLDSTQHARLRVFRYEAKLSLPVVDLWTFGLWYWRGLPKPPAMPVPQVNVNEIPYYNLANRDQDREQLPPSADTSGPTNEGQASRESLYRDILEVGAPTTCLRAEMKRTESVRRAVTTIDEWVQWEPSLWKNLGTSIWMGTERVYVIRACLSSEKMVPNQLSEEPSIPSQL
jgi:hypothetical protein